MSDSERLLKKFGGQRSETTHHIIYELNGVRFSLHRGNKPNPQEIYRVKKLLRRMGLI